MGKIPVMGVGGTVKSNARNGVLHGKVEIQSGKELAEYSQKTLSKVGSSTFKSVLSNYDNSHRTCVYVPPELMRRNDPAT